MATIKGDYWQFYLDGRGEKRRLKNDIDEEALVEEMMSKGTPLRDAVLSACVRAAAPLEAGKAKRMWVYEHSEAIKAAGDDADAAYAAYLQGRTDDLAYGIEEAVLGALDEKFGEEGDDEGESEEEDEEDEAEDDK
jgi:hypothetical protein